MYFMGHSALGVALALPLLFAKRRASGRDALGLTPGLVVLLILSANLPDVIHFEDFRIFSHNLFACVALSTGLGLALRKNLGLDRTDIAAVVLAGLAHPIGDLTFGDYHPFFPFQTEAVSLGVWRWNGPEQLRTEAILSALLLLVLLHPRLAGRELTGAWRGRKDTVVRLALSLTILLLAANLTSFAIVNFIDGVNRGITAGVLFVEGAFIGVPFLRAGLTSPGRSAGSRAAGDDAYT